MDVPLYLISSFSVSCNDDFDITIIFFRLELIFFFNVGNMLLIFVTVLWWVDEE